MALNYADERGSHPLPVYDARPLRSELSPDREGFILSRHESPVSEFYDAGQVKTIYYPEIEELAINKTCNVAEVCLD